MRAIRRLLKWLGFDVCPHSFDRWEDMYTHSWDYDYNLGASVESQSKPHTRLKQQRRCYECNLVEYRRINMRTTTK